MDDLQNFGKTYNFNSQQKSNITNFGKNLFISKFDPLIAPYEQVIRASYNGKQYLWKKNSALEKRQIS